MQEIINIKGMPKKEYFKNYYYNNHHKWYSRIKRYDIYKKKKKNKIKSIYDKLEKKEIIKDNFIIKF